MNRLELAQLNGQSVLVRSDSDSHEPPAALRGTIDAHAGPQGEPEVKIILEYPDMNNTAARRGAITIGEEDAERLLAQSREGICEFTIHGPIEPGPEPAGPQAVS